MLHIATLALILAAALQATSAISIDRGSYKPKFCYAPPPLQYGRYEPVLTHYYNGQKIQFYCNDGYQLHGSEWISCVYNAQGQYASFSNPPPVCRRKLFNL